MQLSIEGKYLDYFSRGVKYLHNKNYDKALSFFKKSAKGAPIKEVFLNMGNAYAQLDREAEAIHYFTKSAQPDVPMSDGTYGPYDLAENNIGLMHFRNGRSAQAIQHYSRSIELNDGKNGDPLWNYANAYLKLCCTRTENDWELAWKLYRQRFFRTSPTPIDTRLPEWDRQSFVDRLVVLSEQGQGDKIQFGRYLHLLKPYCKELIVQVPESMNVFYKGYNCVEELEPYLNNSVCVPFCDLARIFPWNSVNADWIDKTDFVPRDFGGGVNILVEWAGSLNHANDRHRSTTSNHFLELQKWGNLWSFRERAPRGIQSLNTQEDWRGSVEAILGSDIVVTVDTSIVHVCGALNHPCIMLQPRKETDWRWGEDSMGWDNLWYPSVMIARNTGDWNTTFKAVDKKLEEFFAKNKPA